ncbi:MAG: protein translocase subunit SecD, partial [Kiritimatiellaceae bacterium]|nr:protein translocase subunit SecD [Kiritimatiellaceae bacterium]
EPEIYPQVDTDNIIVRLPGITAENIQEAEGMIERAAFLQFRLVHLESEQWVSELFANRMAPKGFKIPDVPNAAYYVRDFSVEEKVSASNLGNFGFRGKAELMLMKDSLPDGSTIYRPTYVEIRNQLAGTSLKDASAQYDQNNQPYISISFDSAGADAFARVTSLYSPRGEGNRESDRGRSLAVVMDGTLYSAPHIREAIYGGKAQITGSFSVEEAIRLSNALRAGSLKAPLNIIQKSEVSPSLGQDSIDSGVRAIVFGGIAVLIFMGVYYMMAGAIADFSLLLVLILLPFGMWFSSGIFGLFTPESSTKVGLPVLTLPGIAGIVLTIGMAVDANVLIFERIREELRAGKSVLGAISSGYDKAFSTILDANVTTFLTAAILFWKGSGAIRGFAVTLSAGIFVSMLVVLIFTRLFLNTAAEGMKLKTFKMFSFVKANTKIDFVGKRKLAMYLSLGLIIITWGIFAAKGQKNLGIDFTGGTSYVFTFEDRPEVETVRGVLTDAGVSDAMIQYQNSFGATETAKMLEVKVGYEEDNAQGKAALVAMQAAFADAGMVEAGEELIGPQIGAELRNQGIWAIVFALIGIIIYISIRFEFAFAVGAIVALLHDVLITIGIYCLLGGELSLPIVAALLTIVGYSVNDTIVVFDRIREDIKLLKGKASYREIANLSINQTLSRTLLTSLTTMLTVTVLLIFGGGAIHDFALALFIGILVGTYSSIFIATPVVLLWHKEKKV